MKAIILAAGSGTRMGNYAQDIPKGMLTFAGHTLIERQIRLFQNAGIKEIIIVTGYKSQKIKYKGVAYYHNQNYKSTNMIETLVCAEKELNTDLVVSYSDILYRGELLKAVTHNSGDIIVSADKDWRKYWMMRYGTTETDLETLPVSENGKISEIGKPVRSPKGIKYRYIGLLKFSQKGIKQLLGYYHSKKAKNEKWKQSGNMFLKGYMTDMLHELIESKMDIQAEITKGNWFEFDTSKDYELALKLYNTGKISFLE